MNAVAQLFLAKFRASCPSQRIVVEGDESPMMTIPPAHPEVGPMRVHLEVEEITVYLGAHFHGHIECVPRDGAVPELARSQGVDRAVEYIKDLLEGRMVYWVETHDGQYRSSGTCGVEQVGLSSVVPEKARRYL